ncbi:unnamed protein product [Mytilus coruscus]|uniref:Uncharacterized protein n=1 Tax=Mytilus coruscus TaxID=42192 RepID=A0A6J8B752_MYTCO|nr:unnamed protein product [Mytilus coruscus]
MDNLEEKSLGLEKLVANQKAEIQKLEEELQDEKDRAADMEHRLQGDIHDLQDSIDEGNQEIETLSRYKKGYDDLYLAFLDTAENEFTKKRKQPVISTKRANLINNIESAQKLEEQLQTVLNTAVEGKLQTVLNTAVEGKLQTVLNTAVEGKLQTVLNTAVKGKLQTVLNTAVEGKLQTVLNTAVEGKLQTVLNTAVEAVEGKLQTLLNTAVEGKLQTVLNTAVEGKLQTVLNTAVEGKLQTVLNTAVEGNYSVKYNCRAVEGKLQTVLNTTVEGKLQTVLNTAVEGKLRTVLNTAVEGKLRTVLNTAVEGKLRTVLNTAVEGKLRTVLNTAVEGKLETVLNTAVEGKLQTMLNTAVEGKLQTVLNTAVEEFDKFLEEHKDELQKIETGKEDVTEAELEIQEMDIEQADQELEAVQERFKNTVGDITNELQLLKHHSLTLQDQLQKLELSKPSHGRKELKILEPEGLTKGDSILSAGLGDEDEKNTEPDPFIPQEQVFSKYAAMVYTSSNNGKSFDTFKEAEFCPSCGEKTVICPHKLPGSEKVFKLPHSCTHIKISRPKVRVNKDIIEEIMKPVSPEYTIDMAPSSADTSGYQRRPVTDSATSRGSPSIMSSEAHMPHSLHRLFDDYKDRTNVERNIPRPLPLDRTLSQIEQFWSYLMWTDENIDEKTIRNSVLDYLYMFMKERYIIEDIMYLCTHDFLSSVAEHSGNDKTVQVFGNILAGNLDGACFRYTMLLCDFIDQVEWKEVEDFRVFAGIAYRSMDDEDLETLQMTYTSFSENKISGQLVCQFIMHLILKCREPRMFDFENKLLPFKTHDAGQQVLTEKEFMDAIDQFVPLSNEKLRKKLYWESETAVRFDGLRDVVPISRLAQILYFFFHYEIILLSQQYVDIPSRNP